MIFLLDVMENFMESMEREDCIMQGIYSLLILHLMYILLFIVLIARQDILQVQTYFWQMMVFFMEIHNMEELMVTVLFIVLTLLLWHIMLYIIMTRLKLLM